MHHMNKNIMLHLILTIMTKWMQWSHCWCLWQHMMMMLVPMASLDHKCHVWSHFDHLELTNGMVSLMALLASCDTYTGINCIKWPKNYIAQCFNYLDIMNTNCAIYNIIGIPSCWCQCQQCQMTEKVILYLILIILNYQMQWYYWWCYQWYVMPILALHD